MTSSGLVLATANPHKVSELRSIFAPLGLTVIGLAELPQPPGGFAEPQEPGNTCEENARIKAVAYCRQTGRPCLADDSGLEIDALGGRPGVISSHFSTGGRETGLSRAERDAANNHFVLELLASTPPELRSARFVCVIALAVPDARTGEPRVLHVARGTFEGRIGTPPRVPAGSNGFGYDPLFLVGPRYESTGAELASSEKNRLSHRAQASAAMARWIAAHPHAIPDSTDR